MSAAQLANLDEMFCTSSFGSYGNVRTTYFTNNTTGQGFNMNNLGMMEIKLSIMCSEITTKSSAPMLQGFRKLRSSIYLPFTYMFRVSYSVEKPPRRLLSFPSCPRLIRTTLLNLLELVQRTRIKNILPHQLYLTLMKRLFRR